MADGSNHGLCVGLRWVWGETQADADARASAGHDQFFNLYSNVLSIHLEDWDASLMCPEVEADPLPLVVVQDAVMELVRGQLPRPDLEIPPGRALTGLPAYLVTNHDLTYTGVHDLTIGPYSTTVDIQATGTMTVDWGDGTVETYSVPGTAYPDGQVSHVYAETGEVSVAATDRWVIEYTVTGPTTITNQMEAELETIAIDSLRVNQVQTVRVDR